MTKKQIAALSNIIANENARLEERKSAVKPGIHAAWDKWIVTDGISAVLLAEKPDGLPEGEEIMEDGRAVTGYYNPWYLVNVVEAVGTNALVYIGYSVQFSKFPSLFVYPKDWMEHNPDRIGFLLSIRQ